MRDRTRLAPSRRWNLEATNAMTGSPLQHKPGEEEELVAQARAEEVPRAPEGRQEEPERKTQRVSVTREDVKSVGGPSGAPGAEQ